jgi:hypothetical protein
MHFLFFLGNGLRLVGGGGGVLGVWRVACGVLCCVFGRCLVLQLSPPAKRRDGGVGAAAAGSRRLACARRLAPGTGRQAAALPPKAYKQAVMHRMLNTTTIMLTSKWLIHKVYKRFRQKV